MTSSKNKEPGIICAMHEARSGEPEVLYCVAEIHAIKEVIAAAEAKGAETISYSILNADATRPCIVAADSCGIIVGIWELEGFQPY